MGKKSSSKIAIIAALTSMYPTFAAPQQGGAGTSGTTAVTTAGTAVASGSTAAAAAGGPPGGFQIDMGVSMGLTVDDNFKLAVGGGTGTSTIFDTRLDFGISSVTPVDTFLVRGSGVLRFADIPGRSISGFESPDLRVSYARDGINSRLSLDARYRHVDREFLDPFQVEKEEQQSGGLVGGGGTLTQRDIGLSWQTGLNSPLGFSVTLRHDERDYENVTNPNIFDRETDSIKTTTSYRVSPVTSLFLNAGVTHYQAQDAVLTDRMTRDLSLGIQQDINPVLTLNSQVGFTEIDTDTSLPVPTSSTRDGLSGSVTLTQTLANGSAWGTISSAVSISGTRTSLRFGRDYQLPLGTLSLAAGATRGPNGSVDAIGSVSYTRQLQASDFSVSLDRSATSNSASEDLLDTRLSLGYGYAINNNSRIDVSLNYGQSENQTTGITIERATLRAAYSRSLTADWNLVGGVQLRAYDETTVGNARSNQLFVTLDRKFSFRP